jgi:hypothetical protein
VSERRHRGIEYRDRSLLNVLCPNAYSQTLLKTEKE